MCDKPAVAKIERSDKSELKKTEMQKKNLLLSKEMIEHVKQVGKS
ncbi:thymosin beta-4-like [Phyllostomus discolor]|uniref:Thymosin beta-4-like n=1 Tax=Phyllostomus discolor TaxID=89673 RepID=A0A7E6EEG7_9CHIR|nr:thymosin beta-4-like [Phyllostomus discolor]